MSPDEKDMLCALVERGMYPEVRIFSEVIGERDHFQRYKAAGEDAVEVKQGEIDWRRRRMEIAAYILDEENAPDLEAVAAILWPLNVTREPPLSLCEQFGHDVPEGALQCARCQQPLTHTHVSDRWCSTCGKYIDRLFDIEGNPQPSGHREDCAVWIQETSPRPDISQPTSNPSVRSSVRLDENLWCPRHGMTVSRADTGDLYCEVDECEETDFRHP